jgi:hypothetical protein
MLFILGPQRAGTSVMLGLAQDVLGYAGAPEGWVWSSVKALEDHFAMARQTLADVDPREVAAFSIARISTDAILNAYVAALAGLHAGRWPAPLVDKTPGPEAVAAAPALRRHLPAARFVFMKRRGIENVQSQLRRFPGRPFETACAMWAESMRTWLTVRDELAEAASEIDQADLHRETDRVAARLATFLGEAAPEPVAEFFRRRFPEKTKSGDYGEDVDLSQAGWNAGQMLKFVELCGPMMEAFGYSLAGEGAASPAGFDLAAGEALGRWVVAARNAWTSTRGPGLDLHPDQPHEPPTTLSASSVLGAGVYQFSGEVIVQDARCRPLSLILSAPGADSPGRWVLPLDGSRVGRNAWEIPTIQVARGSDVVLEVVLDPGCPNYDYSAVRLNSAVFIRR